MVTGEIGLLLMSYLMKSEVILKPMVAPSRYWIMWIIDSPRVEYNKLKDGYKLRTIHLAQEFFRVQFPKLASQPTLSSEENRHVQAVVWKMFRSADDIRDRAFAGLCLRCYVSQTILISCKKISHTCKPQVENPFSYIDLLPFVLNDDGKEEVLLDSEEQTQLILNHDYTTRPIAKGGEFFSVEILRKFNPTLSSSESLDNWTWRLTQQNQNLRLFLWELGVRTPSDCALLCRHIPRSLEPHLQKGDREIVEVFHAVYRRDRRNSHEKGRCSEPTLNQLQEMRDLLQQRNIIHSHQKLIYHLKRIAEILRQDTLYKRTGSPKTIPIEVYDNSTNDYVPNLELGFYTDTGLEEIELDQLKEDCHALFEEVLYEAISEVIYQQIEGLRKSKGYKSFAQKFHEGLQLYYEEDKSLGEIGKLWGIPWYQARRIFKLENFLENVQYRTEEKFIDNISKTSTKYRVTTISTNPDYLKNVAESIRNYALNKTFNDAHAEIQSGKKQQKNSLFAQLIRRYLNDSIKEAA
ncbi:hypothetical protein PI95_012680 [Hassallia byssoidea VB512170]|uniref:Uncharacterized protein n=1 Tax=Hassallia byssoidea VB512170 TaxID=1304833 RepID=A0A846H8X0_9CYAN|nr:hypothetical protein [Hassalia byssoidea]NEU73398.1 hypothetical protein [Hassalia byssoidea VB512170]